MTYKHLGWLVSPYSAKTRSYLKYKQIPHEDVAPSLFSLMTKVKGAVGRAIMPTIFTPEGEVWQDSSEIIDAFEARFPDNPVIPTTPKQRLAAYLLELHGDEWLAGVALHYRWSNPTNTKFALTEFGRNALPWAPRFLQRIAAKKLAGAMQRYLPSVGAVGETRAGIESFTKTLLTQLDAHFAQHPYLLGARPCIGDFAMFGPLWAHLYRDIGSTALFDDTPHIRAWFDRLLGNTPQDPGDFLPNDEVPDTLDPIFQTMFAEQFVFLRTLLAKVHENVEANPDATRVPRSLGTTSFQIGGVAGTRKLVTFAQWMAQRSLDAYQNAANADKSGTADKASMDEWLERVGGSALKETKVTHRLARKNYKEVLERSLGATRAA